MEWAIRTGKFNLFFTGAETVPILRPSLPDFIKLGSNVVAPGLTFFAASASSFLAAVRAFASDDKVNILSSPSVMTTENKKAVINVSTSVPIVTSQQVPVATGGITGNSITQSVEYRDAGVILTVTPRMDAEERVHAPLCLLGGDAFPVPAEPDGTAVVFRPRADLPEPQPAGRSVHSASMRASIGTFW
jgi:hypothetical protein